MSWYIPCWLGHSDLHLTFELFFQAQVVLLFIEEQLRTLEMKVQAQRNKYRDALKNIFRDKPQSA